MFAANKIKVVMFFLLAVLSLVVGFYFFNFNYSLIKNNGWLSVFDNLSKSPGDWGVFGDYIGGILNPSIALIALYLLVETYKLQKNELEATRSLLKISTNDQKCQIKLSALTAHLNSVLMRIEILKSERLSLLQGVPIEPRKSDGSSALPQVNNLVVDRWKKQVEELQEVMAKNFASFYSTDKGTQEGQRFLNIEKEIKELTVKSFELERQIESFYKENIS